MESIGTLANGETGTARYNIAIASASNTNDSGSSSSSSYSSTASDAYGQFFAGVKPGHLQNQVPSAATRSPALHRRPSADSGVPAFQEGFSSNEGINGDSGDHTNLGNTAKLRYPPSHALLNFVPNFSSPPTPPSSASRSVPLTNESAATEAAASTQLTVLNATANAPADHTALPFGSSSPSPTTSSGSSRSMSSASFKKRSSLSSTAPAYPTPSHQQHYYLQLPELQQHLDTHGLSSLTHNVSSSHSAAAMPLACSEPSTTPTPEGKNPFLTCSLPATTGDDNEVLASVAPDEDEGSITAATTGIPPSSAEHVSGSVTGTSVKSAKFLTTRSAAASFTGTINTVGATAPTPASAYPWAASCAASAVPPGTSQGIPSVPAISSVDFNRPPAHDSVDHSSEGKDGQARRRWFFRSNADPKQPSNLADASAAKLGGATPSTISSRLPPRRCKVPFFALMLTYMAVSTVSVGIIGWQFTINSARSSIQDLAEKIQARAASEIVSTLEENSRVITQVTTYQREMVESDEWSFLPDRVNATKAGMLSLLKFFRQWAVNIVIVQIPIGDLFAWGYTDNPNDWSVVSYNNTNLTLTATLCTENGTAVLPLFNQYDPGDGTPANPGNNRTLLLINGFTFGHVDLYNNSYHKVGTMYGIKGEAHKSAIAIAYNNVTKERLLVANDWTMTFVRNKLQSVLAQIPYPMFVGAFESQSGKLIGTSIGADYLTPDGNNVLAFPEVPIPYLQDFTDFIQRRYPNTNVSTQAQNLASDISSMGPVIYYTNLNGSDFAVRIDLAYMAWDEPWLTLQFLSLTPILSDITWTAGRVQAIVLTVVAVAVMVGTAVAYVLARQIRMVAVQIAALKDMKFQEVMDRERGVRSRSFVLELYDLQVSFFEMITRFAEQVRASRNLLRGNTSGGGGTIG